MSRDRYTGPLGDRPDRLAHAHDVHVAGPDGAEAEPGVVGQIGPVVQRATDADVHRVVLDQEFLLEGTAEDGAVRDGRVEVGVPGVQVRVEVDERDRPVLPDHGTQHRQGDRMVPADRDDGAAAGDQFGRVGADLLHRRIDGERGDRDVPGVHHLDLTERAAAKLDVMPRPQVP
jgi:hypothetical protein